MHNIHIQNERKKRVEFYRQTSRYYVRTDKQKLNWTVFSFSPLMKTSFNLLRRKKEIISILIFVSTCQQVSRMSFKCIIISSFLANFFSRHTYRHIITSSQSGEWITQASYRFHLNFMIYACFLVFQSLFDSQNIDFCFCLVDMMVCWSDKAPKKHNCTLCKSKTK